MGIPSYYKNIIQDYPNIIIQENDFNIPINNLFLDLNCAIHPCCRGLTDENEMFEKIFEKIVETIKLTNVKDLIYIAIDGPAPRTKMEQQRQRRLKSFHEKKIWDTNQITPGTSFMNNLNNYLKEKCKTLKIPSIISDSNEPGEGEHKIMKYIDNLPLNNINIVYGLDADLIMLSMIRKHKVYLLRERTEYNLEKLDCNYVYCDIDLLKKYLIQSIKKSYFNISNQTLLNDYLFLCFLIGNDFVINTPCINIRYKGINHLLDIYSLLQKEYNGEFYLLDRNKKLHFKYFQLYIKRLSLKEKDILNDIFHIRKNQSNKYKKIYSKIFSKLTIKNISEIQYLSHEKLNFSKEIFDDFKNNSPIIYMDDEQKIINTKDVYYMINFYDKQNYEHSYKYSLEYDKKNLCKEYLKSLQWTLDYYFHECSNWRWYYQYHFAPLLTDFDQYINNLSQGDLNKIVEKNNKPYKPKEQLKIVLPQLDDNYYYPKYTPLHSFMKRYYWECHPIMPH